MANATGKTIPTLRTRYTSTCSREIRVRPRVRVNPPRIGAHNRRTRISSGNARAIWVGRYVHGKLEAGTKRPANRVLNGKAWCEKKASARRGFSIGSVCPHGQNSNITG